MHIDRTGGQYFRKNTISVIVRLTREVNFRKHGLYERKICLKFEWLRRIW